MIEPGSTVPRQCASTTRAYTAVDDVTGEPIGLDDIDIRAGWLLDLVACAGTEMVSRLWREATFDVLAAGRDQQDRTLPAQGHVAAARLGWEPNYPDGTYVPSRVSRVVTAQVMTVLRTLTYRDTAITTLSARFDPATGAITAPATAADHVPSGFARGVRRQLIARSRQTNATSCTRLRITDLQSPPQTSAMARLSATDRQFAQITSTEAELVLRVKLPTSPTPAGRAHWRWVRLTAAIPAHLHRRAVIDWHLPTLVLDRRSRGERSTGNWPSTSLARSPTTPWQQVRVWSRSRISPHSSPADTDTSTTIVARNPPAAKRSPLWRTLPRVSASRWFRCPREDLLPCAPAAASRFHGPAVTTVRGVHVAGSVVIVTISRV